VCHRRGLPPPAVGFRSGLLKFQTQIPVFGCTFGQKINSCESQNTTHVHSRLYYVHPARGNTTNGTSTGIPARITTDAGKRARKRDVPAKTGRVATYWRSYYTIHQHCEPIRIREASPLDKGKLVNGRDCPHVGLFIVHTQTIGDSVWC